MAVPVRWHDPHSARPRDCFTAGGYPKLRYEQRWQAKSAARKLAAQGKGECRAYLCPRCGYFHIGHEAA